MAEASGGTTSVVGTAERYRYIQDYTHDRGFDDLGCSSADSLKWCNCVLGEEQLYEVDPGVKR
jgi:hypothetical protein